MKHIRLHSTRRLPLFILVAVILTLNLVVTGCGGSTPASTSTGSITTADSTTTADTTTTADSTSAAEKTFTLAELAEYNGKDGKEVYVAVEGVVYDVSKLAKWATGFHQELHYAGADLTDDIKNDSPHGVKMLTRATRVGTLVK